MACGSKEFDPPFPFPPRESRGGDGSPHAAHDACQPKPLSRIDAAAPPARGVSKRSAETPLARSPRLQPPAGRPGAKMIARGKIEDGRHVGLDFYDLLIEPIFTLNIQVGAVSGQFTFPDKRLRWNTAEFGASHEISMDDLRNRQAESVRSEAKAGWSWRGLGRGAGAAVPCPASARSSPGARIALRPRILRKCK
jgi:hypothetical protein